jgi:hypothetical protein
MHNPIIKVMVMSVQAMVLSQQMLQQKYAENQRVRGVLCEVGDPELDRYLEDERIALFLQNEEFMAELRWNKDFLLTLEKGEALLEHTVQCVLVWTASVV